MTDKLREALERIIALDVPVNIVDVMDSTAREAVEIAKAALAQQDAQAVPQGLYTVISFLLGEGPLHGLYFGEHKEGQGSFWWRTHLRDAMLNAAPTPPAQDVTWKEYVETACALIKAADDAAADCDYMLDSDDCIKVLRGQWKAPLANDFPARPQPAPAPKPLGWLDRKAVECLQGSEMTWMPAWNRPTSADPVPIFLSPPAQRVMLTDDEIDVLWAKQQAKPFKTHGEDRMDFARAVIEAYEKKNGISQPGYTAPDMASQGASQFRAGHDAAQSEIAELEQENRLLRARNDRLQKEIEQKGER